MPSAYVTDLIDHKQRVSTYLLDVAHELALRAARHDNSKFSEEEYAFYDEAFPKLQQYAYGTPEFKAELEKIAPAIHHHYYVNDHHPEHFEDGINDMNLIQLIEMVCDWLAASERSKTPFSKGMEMNQQRFHINPQLMEIIINTAQSLIRL